jgi:hypothetical protein
VDCLNTRAGDIRSTGTAVFRREALREGSELNSAVVTGICSETGAEGGLSGLSQPQNSSNPQPICSGYFKPEQTITT